MNTFCLWFRSRRARFTTTISQPSELNRVQSSGRSRGGIALIRSLQPNLRTLSFILLIAAGMGVGAETVHASPNCQRLIRVYSDKLVRNPVSKITAARWSLWNKSHPNFHPHPRPRYTLSKQETMKRLDFACAVEIGGVGLDLLLPPLDPVEMTPLLRTTDLNFAQAPPLGTSELPLVASAVPPPYLPPAYPLGGTPLAGGPQGFPPLTLGPPLAPVVGISPVPEPPALILLGTGLILLLTQRKAIRAKCRA